MAGSPPTPSNILRGHKAQVHAARFLEGNERLATGDAEGFVVLWDLAISRPKAVWRAHEGAILGIRGWGRDRVITHGRDHRLVVWQVREDDEQRLSTQLPLEDVPTPRPQPWILHLLEVNTMNFCSFSACPQDSQRPGSDISAAEAVCIAVPNTLASDAVSGPAVSSRLLPIDPEQIDIFLLPSQVRAHTVRVGKDTGMAMSTALVNVQGSLALIASFENGVASVLRLQTDGVWTTTYHAQAHTQPVLSLDVHPSLEYFLTSSADAIIAKHPIPTSQQDVIPDFDPSQRIIEEVDDAPGNASSLLSKQLKGAGPPGLSSNIALKPWQHPIKTINTKHSGQQSLEIRSDGRVFATAGWDSNVRVYSCKTMKQLAVLQWHKVGCYAVALASVEETLAPDTEPTKGPSINGLNNSMQGSSLQLSRHRMTVKDRRLHRAKATHWIAAGAKDGRVSLWDIY